MNWEDISKDPTLSADFIRDHADKLNFDEIARNNVNLTHACIKELQNDINFTLLSFNEHTPLESVRTYHDRMNANTVLLIHFPLPDDIFQSIQHKLDWSYLSSDHLEIFPKDKRKIEFLRTYKEYLHWSSICMHYELPEVFMEEMEEHLDWQKVSMYQKMSRSFVEKYYDKLDHLLIHQANIKMQNFSFSDYQTLEKKKQKAQTKQKLLSLFQWKGKKKI